LFEKLKEEIPVIKLSVVIVEFTHQLVEIHLIRLLPFIKNKSLVYDGDLETKIYFIKETENKMKENKFEIEKEKENIFV
jgi:hypothetical protein